METRSIVLHGQTRAKPRRVAKRCRDADTRARHLIVLRAAEGWSGKRIVEALGCSASTVSRTLDRWESYGEAGLIDRREDNGQTKGGCKNTIGARLKLNSARWRARRAERIGMLRCIDSSNLWNAFWNNAA